MLVIGVKTAVVRNFHRRQAIRDSWADPDKLPHDAKVLFLGCDPNAAADFQNGHERRRVLVAVAKERTIYRDLLTEELGCTDGYKKLTDKAASFMDLAVTEFPSAKFVMIIDNDVYVKVDQLAENLRVANSTGLYFGEVWAVVFGNKQKPIRDQSSQYYLPEDQYPMRGLLPYVAGPHSAISMDGVRFIAKNYWRLRSLNDVSVGTRQFSSVRASTNCSDDLVSFADLSSLGIRSIHVNLVNNRSFCHGFHSVTWHQNLNSAPTMAEMLRRPTQEETRSTPLQLETHLDSPVKVIVIVSSTSNAGLKMQFTPSAESVNAFIHRLCSKLPQCFPTSPPCQALTPALAKMFEV